MALNKSLQINTFIPSSEILPANVQYIDYTAESSGNNVVFQVRKPAINAMLDTEALLEWGIDLDLLPGFMDGMFLPVNELLPAQGNRFALRQGFLSHRLIKSAEVSINNALITEPIQQYTDIIARYYATRKESETIFTGSGGEMDEGSPRNVSNRDFVLNRPVQGPILTEAANLGPFTGANTIRSALPMDKKFYNVGYSNRVSDLQRLLKLDSGFAGQAYRDSFIIDLIDRLPLSPFMMYDMRDTHNVIPYIEQLRITLNFENISVSPLDKTNVGKVFQGNDINLATGFPLGVESLGYSPIFKLKLKWIIPPMQMKLPRSVKIPMTGYRMYHQEIKSVPIANADIRSIGRTDTFDNIRLQQIPDRLFIYISPLNAKQFYQSSEAYATIITLTFRINGVNGKLVRLTGNQLYYLYNRDRRSDLREDFTTWELYHCVAVLRPEDIGLPSDTGKNDPIQMSITVRYQAFNKTPDYKDDGVPDLRNLAESEGISMWPVDGRVQLNVLCEYNKFQLTINRTGGANYKLMNANGLPLR
jgi:hypothetical protein